MTRPNFAPEIRRSLTDVRRLCDALGLTAQGGHSVKRQAGGGLIVRCPWHSENTPSCSIRIAADGTVAAKCFGCDRGGDALDLVAACRGLARFPDVLAEAATIAGRWDIVAALQDADSRAATGAPTRFHEAVATSGRPEASEAHSEPPREWPPQAEVLALWNACRETSDDAQIAEYLGGRALDPARIDGGGLARALPGRGALPQWATFGGSSWRDTGHRLIIPVRDESGEIRSVRAWRVVDGDSPKRLPAAGHKASGLVMADEFGIAMLSGRRPVETVVIMEGESDFLSRCMVTNDPNVAVLGIYSGAWGQQFADRLPIGARVVIRTDGDAAGNKYADSVAATVRRRCFVFRMKEAA